MYVTRCFIRTCFHENLLHLILFCSNNLIVFCFIAYLLSLLFMCHQYLVRGKVNTSPYKYPMGIGNEAGIRTFMGVEMVYIM